jgi:ABC-type transport system involved in cytochrome bd biosynthesis fused ATPase/permease subunit
VQFEDNTTCGSAFKIYEIQSISQVIDQQLTRPEEEEVSELKRTFLDALKGLEAVRKYTCQFDSENSINVTCSKV